MVKTILRAASNYIFINYFTIVYIILLFLKDKHLLHDIIADTSVINNGQEENLYAHNKNKTN